MEILRDVVDVRITSISASPRSIDDVQGLRDARCLSQDVRQAVEGNIVNLIDG